MTPPFATAYARTSCSRCHKRKKRCDRTLPQCENCHKAHVACSFLDDDRQTASYPIGYVRSLESRIQDLENQLAGSPGAPGSSANGEASLADGISVSGQKPDDFTDELVVIDADGACPPAFYGHDESWGDFGIHPEDIAPRSVREPTHSLDEELKQLSLEATAERHLGSSSGLSFAKLTQMVLRRLTPDKADFVFANDDDEDQSLQQFNVGSHSELLDSFMFNNFGNPTACDPILFGDYPLSAIAAPDEAVAHLALLTDDAKPFADADEEDIKPEGIQPPSSLNPSLIAVPLHILALRRIAGKMATLVYSNQRVAHLGPQERDEILRSLHKELIDWRRNMPFPLPDVNAQVPHLTSNWYDFNYYTHLAMLYRPTPLFPTLDQHRIKILAEAASMSIRQATNMHRQKRFAYNWLNLLSVFTATLSLIYAVTAQPDNLVAVLEETKATEDLELSIDLFQSLSIKFPAAKKMQRMVDQVVKKYGELHNKSEGFRSSVG
ncbi:hypothetical protein G7Z17_g11266 [Cylindrodendrum hubeiense]|uniref:Zn(2)-C6 fungal-type domain-containing protein n=1 Tax=Cylindrodendrum hubeiense TaxID=595255 RepID=A0A9P5GXV5_9HYPO|nr:hypothetical protein G7Z17_g11266 [Cylindrodendrum hubeiense]